MAQSYDELSGAEGREIFFRAERFPARAFFGDRQPKVRLHNHEVALLDLSMSGLALEVPAEEMNGFAKDAEFPLVINFNGKTLFEGTGRVARIEEGDDGAKLGVSLPSAYLDLDALRAEILQVSAVSDGKINYQDMRRHVSQHYRAFIADLSFLLQGYKREIERFVTKTNPTEEQIEEFLQACEATAIPQWRALCEEGNDLMAGMTDADELRWSKLFTEINITTETVASPLQRRAYEKPLGYPGDYRVMDYVYEWAREGDTPYAQFMHRLALEPMECVKTRLKKQEDIILREIESANKSEPFRITNMACGTAQEIRNLLDRNAFTSPIDMTLIDQEKNTLAYAYERTYPAVQKLKGLVTLKYWNASFKQLLRPNELLSGLAGQDLIYSLGLFDYLKEKRGQRLVGSLYDKLAPGGLLVIANLKEGAVSKWTSEFMSDWSMIYRTSDEMKRLADGLDGADVTIETDDLDEILFLKS